MKLRKRIRRIKWTLQRLGEKLVYRAEKPVCRCERCEQQRNFVAYYGPKSWDL